MNINFQCLTVTEGARILAVETVAGRSHWNFLSAILNTLSTRHQITAVTPFLEGNRENYTEIDISQELFSFLNVSLLKMKEGFGTPWSFSVNAHLHSRISCDHILHFKPLKDIILRGRGQYDLLILEPTLNPCSAYLGSKLDVPQVYAIPFLLPTWTNALMFGHRSNPSHEANMFLSATVPNGFCQRFHNTIIHMVTVGVPWFMATVNGLRQPDRYYDLISVRHDPAMVFVNDDQALGNTKQIPVNMKQIGGIHLSSHPRPLPTDILEFIENSPHGVIYFTFGSVVSMSTLPENLLNAFKEALAQVPQRVLWKYEGEMKNKPANVMTSKWFPQRDILLHPNVKLFISHGGISSVYEAVDAGVPVLGFPLFYDQPRNIANLVDAGMALSMDLFTVSKEPFLNAVLELINNQNYTINAKITSERFKDRPMTPAESVIYWTEYVLRHKGAPHLRSQALNLTWYQYYLLDVIAAILVILSVILYVIYKTLKVILQFVLKRPNKLKSKSE
ncbi:UDP-glucosyltransferase 2-like isoform X4 [Adelges cooleyi]|uniref:UDP-glucosyltransferase 2-like isoform X4 n=1 Tax=Adelges cooleyi TaxID=133065 RepID=UPI00217F736B|nr:UDP-glucosyltransferase 2-like isoform X4 [Adelges cooleyi]